MNDGSYARTRRRVSTRVWFHHGWIGCAIRLARSSGKRLFRLFVIRLLPRLWEEKGGVQELLFVNMDDFSGSIVE